MERQTRYKTKYNAKKTRLDGYIFDSKAEANRYSELKLLVAANEITHLTIHPRFKIIAAAVIDGEEEPAIYYEADFKYLEDSGWIVEDVKGFRTQVYRLKRRLFLQQYTGMAFREVEA